MGDISQILICDDSMLIRRKLKESIELCCRKVHIIEAREGLEAMRLFKQYHPDLVFMDIILPGKNGIDVVKEIKDCDKEARIVMVSSVGTKANLYKAFGAGAIDFIQKPWTQDVIDRVIEKYIPEQLKVETELDLTSASGETVIPDEALEQSTEGNLEDNNEDDILLVTNNEQENSIEQDSDLKEIRDLKENNYKK